MCSRRRPTRPIVTLVSGALAALVIAGCSPGDHARAPEGGSGTLLPATAVATAIPPSTPAPEPTPAPAPTSTPVVYDGPELTGLTGWLNSEPFTVAERVEAGGVVLVDFWTYSCINCIRTLPSLVAWQEKYGDRGLTIIGVHTPEFRFEREAANVLEAMKRHGIEYAVAQDNDEATWDAFGVRAWPTKFLFGADGVLRWSHVGEGAYVETEAVIREALTDAGFDVSDVPAAAAAAPSEEAAPLAGLTEELYAGYGWNYGLGAKYVRPIEYYVGPDREVMYEDASYHHYDRIYLQGLWRNGRDALIHARETPAPEDYIVVRMIGRSVNAVLSLVGAESGRAVVKLDGRALTPAEAGADVRFDGAGRSYVTVTGARSYGLLDLPVGDEYAPGLRAPFEHELSLWPATDGFALHSLTFGDGPAGP